MEGRWIEMERRISGVKEGKIEGRILKRKELGKKGKENLTVTPPAVSVAVFPTSLTVSVTPPRSPKS